MDKRNLVNVILIGALVVAVVCFFKYRNVPIDPHESEEIMRESLNSMRERNTDSSYELPNEPAEITNDQSSEEPWEKPAGNAMTEPTVIKGTGNTGKFFYVGDADSDDGKLVVILTDSGICKRDSEFYNSLISYANIMIDDEMSDLPTYAGGPGKGAPVCLVIDDGEHPYAQIYTGSTEVKTVDSELVDLLLLYGDILIDPELKITNQSDEAFESRTDLPTPTPIRPGPPKRVEIQDDNGVSGSVPIPDMQEWRQSEPDATPPPPTPDD
ncbi:hypothetical protein IKF84_02605 [Candidatus Saccharibacteria bacterium]|nr:hypothetical protein [Candidatus Saccharibacteria bacterium]